MKNLTIGIKLRKLRRDLDITQTALGKKIGVKPSYISKYERELALPSLKALMKLSRALHVPIDAIVFDEPLLTGNNFKDQELYKRFLKIHDLPEEKKEIIKTYLDGFLAGK